MAVHYEYQQIIRTEVISLTLECEPCWWDETQLNVDVFSAYNEDGQLFKMNKQQIVLSWEDVNYIWEKLDDLN